MLLISYFQLIGRLFDVAIRVTADRLAPGTYLTKLDMSEADVDNGTMVYAGGGSVHIVKADGQFAGSVEGSMAPITGAIHSPPPPGALQLGGHLQCNQA